MSTSTEGQAVIGLEIHAQVVTRSKMFCGCDAHYAGAEPNTHVCAICLGMPGALPVINRKAVQGTISAAIALNCTVNQQSRFDRKNYQYPDIPKGYQISQYDSPIAVRGWLDYQVGGELRRCRITRVHLEEDTGKSTHTSPDGREVSLVDYNRSGVPLMEIVTEPDLTSSEEARAFFESLRQLLMYLEVCDGKLQEGSLRADVNVSLRRSADSLGDKVEIKNLNSFRSVQRAIEYELTRQNEVLDRGEAIEQETRGWNERDEVTVSQRTKEYAQDYRYFPEPDLPGLHVTAEHVRQLSAALPATPSVRAGRLREQMGLSPYLAEVLTKEKPLADYFEEVVRQAPEVPPVVTANWITGDLARLLKESGRPVELSPVPPVSLASLVNLVCQGTISGAAGKHVLEEMYRTGKAPETIIRERGLTSISDETKIEPVVNEVLLQNPSMVEQYEAGKTRVSEALLGKVLGAGHGNFQPMVARHVLEGLIGPPAAANALSSLLLGQNLAAAQAALSLAPKMVEPDTLKNLTKQFSLGLDIADTQFVRAQVQQAKVLSSVLDQYQNLPQKLSELVNGLNAGGLGEVWKSFSDQNLGASVAFRKLQDMYGVTPNLQLFQRINKENREWRRLLNSQLAIPELQTPVPALAWQLSMGIVSSRASEIRLPRTHPRLYESLLNPLFAFSRFSRGAVGKIEAGVSSHTYDALMGCLAFLDAHSVESAGVVQSVLCSPTGQDDTARRPWYSAPREIRDDLLRSKQLAEDLDPKDVLELSPAAQKVSRARHIVSLISQINESAKLRGHDEVFKPTTRLLEACSELPWVVSTGRVSFGNVIDWLFFILYEGAGSDELRYWPYLEDRDATVVWAVKKLRNYYLRHDPDHGVESRSRDKWLSLGESLKWLGLTGLPRLRQDYEEVHARLLYETEQFLELLRSSI